MGLFGRKDKAHAMETWGVIHHAPIDWLELDRADVNLEVNPRPFWKGYNSTGFGLFPNMQGGGLPTGNLYAVPLPNQTNPDQFIYANARLLNPPKVVLSGGAQPTSTGNVTMQNAMGSSQAGLSSMAIAGSAHNTAPYGNFGVE